MGSQEKTIMLSPGQKAQKTARWARTMTKWLITYSRKKGAKWQLVEFGGPTGSESYGIVDILAIRKAYKVAGDGARKGDLFEIVLIQAKGGLAKFPTDSDIERLIKVGKHHRAKAIVLAEWKKQEALNFYQLVNRNWIPISPDKVFG